MNLIKYELIQGVGLSILFSKVKHLIFFIRIHEYKKISSVNYVFEVGSIMS